MKLLALLPDDFCIKLIESYISKLRKNYLISGNDPDDHPDSTTVREKFNEFKNEIKTVFESNKEKRTLFITSENTDTLVQSGYVSRRLDSFLFINQFTQKQLNEFYQSECINLGMEDIGPVTIGQSSPKVSEVIDATKTEAVGCFLWLELARLIAMLKEESISLN